MRRTDESEHHSVTVRKIENGWLETRSKSDGSGYSSVERFHTERPMVEGSSTKEAKTSSGALKAAATFAAQKSSKRG
jgi:hypothetical protein